MRRAKFSLASVFWLLALPACVVLWLGLGESASPYDWQWRRAFRHVLAWREGAPVPGPLLEGLGLTVRIVGVSLGLSVFLGLAAALLRRLPLRVGRAIAVCYVGLARNTPLLIQLFAMYFVLAPVLGLSPFWAGAWALSASEGAYMAEVFRAGINGVPRRQWEAARSLGMPPWSAFGMVILPQALRRVLPPFSSQTVSLVKDSALVSAIALPDITMQTQVGIADTFLSLELWIIAAAMYLLLTLLVSLPAQWMEGRYAWKWL